MFALVMSEDRLSLQQRRQEIISGALKVKELAYMHSEGILAGELKHGPLALVDDEMPVLMIVLRDPVYIKCMNALQQVTSRKVDLLLFANKAMKKPNRFLREAWKYHAL
ncbi:Glutamine--fructose-6-phosphate aminotransferase 2 [Eumeta japonica]|uniref:Glutamine--fructose-6-phosphate aminotransferase 2 n=1 Tax=Eumeta variegata TaxID=151549 RepID=A0A4C1TSU0_EUMVA|nr:Glutamine--fructose-6-phosphate aminotransferase 2 [Eumeta japonica]